MFFFDMSMSWRETWYFFFKNKRCPHCGSSLERDIKTTDEGWDWQKEQEGLNFNLQYGHTTKAKVFYECRPCRAWYPISELAIK